jgi:hypothetical protein
MVTDVIGKAKQKLSMQLDEISRIYATPVKSDYELAVEKELSEFIHRVGLYEHPTSTRPRWKTDKEMWEAFWNEKLN